MIRKNLGSNLSETLTRKEVLNLINESSIKNKIKAEEWIEAC